MACLSQSQTVMKAAAFPLNRGRAICRDKRRHENGVLSQGYPAEGIMLLGEWSSFAVWISPFSPTEDYKRDAF